MFFIPFCIRMLKNKAQIAWESISFQGSWAGPGFLPKRTSGFVLAMCMHAHNSLRPPPPIKILDPPLRTDNIMCNKTTKGYLVYKFYINRPTFHEHRCTFFYHKGTQNSLYTFHIHVSLQNMYMYTLCKPKHALLQMGFWSIGLNGIFCKLISVVRSIGKIAFYVH